MKFFKFQEHIEAQSYEKLVELKRTLEGYPDPETLHRMIDEEMARKKVDS